MVMPAPTGSAVLGHLARWRDEPLELLEDGATLGPAFGLRLWRRAVVGYSPQWNQLVLGDLARFRSRGSLSQLSPYLHGGVVATDAPEHRGRRAELNPNFHRRAVTDLLADRLGAAVKAELPDGRFDAVAWSSAMVRRFLHETFVGPSFPVDVLEHFLAPLDTPIPGPLLPRPIRVRRMERALARTLRSPDPGTLAEHFTGLDNGVEEARVALAAAYDTTAHAMSWALWELAARPGLNTGEMTGEIVHETLRLYPSGWIGSRICAVDVDFAGHVLPAGRLVLYSPYLTHRSAELWPEPTAFRPERFREGTRPAWGYLPFAAGERMCLGSGLATLMLRTTVAAFAGVPLRQVGGDPRPCGGLTLTPRGPLTLHRGEHR
ncbi:MAG: cytochrome P450 [Actinomycetota bacterium]|nr:cytochrome P450 [Actinomycetota bacterium]